MRIVSLLPSATEIVCALGLEESLVGITHECDHPEAIRGRPVLTVAKIHAQGLTSRQIDHAVTSSLAGHEGIYTLDEKRLAELAPDLVLTQELCDVCAVSYKEVKKASKVLAAGSKVVSLEPTTIEGIFENVLTVGDLTGRAEKARSLVAGWRARLAVVRAKTAGLPRPRVFMCEWLDPFYAAGHWVAEQVEISGGAEIFGRVGELSVRASMEEVAAGRPDVVVLCPCGYYAGDIERELATLRFPAGWDDLPAVRAGQVWAVDASAYYSRPGPRVVEGAELLARILHPDVFGGPDPAMARRVATRAAS